jgi:hypothetical protein
VPALNQALELMGDQDILKLRRYTRVPRGLVSVKIEGHGRTGYITYGPRYNGRSSPTKNTIEVSRESSHVLRNPPADTGYGIGFLPLYQRPRPLAALPYHVYDSILRYVTYIPGGGHVDRITHAFRAVGLGVLRASRRARSDAMVPFLQNNGLILTYKSSGARVRLLNSNTINGWLAPAKHDTDDLRHYLQNGNQKPGAVVLAKRIALIFEFPHVLTEDVRISVVAFIIATMQVKDSVVITCRIVPRESDTTLSSPTPFTLRELRMNVFIILSHVLDAKPWRTNQVCPAVYVNGLGTAVETINPGRKRF